MPQARITGHVVLADTQDPARNAVVLLNSLDGQNRQFQRVGLDGTYLFEHVVPGEYIIIPYLDGYLSPFDKLTLTPADTTIAALFEKIVVAQGSLKVGAQGTQTFNISLERGATVSGRVLYSDGSPAIQVGIELQNTADPSPRPGSPYIQLGDIARSEFVHSAPETDDQGHFRIAGIRPGTYRIAAVQLQKLPMQPDETMIRSILGALRFYTNDTVHPGSAKAYSSSALVKGPLDASVTAKIEGYRQELGQALYQSILTMVAQVRSARDIPNQQLQQSVLNWMESATRGMAQVRKIAAEIPETTFYSILDRHGVQSLAEVPNFGVLKRLVDEVQAAPHESAA